MVVTEPWWGGLLTPETGLIYLTNRYYDPATAQFLTVDPLANLTQSPYGYVGDNPLNGTDPSGLWGWNPFQDIGQG
jgi:RHS repeat-associated protein